MHFTRNLKLVAIDSFSMKITEDHLSTDMLKFQDRGSLLCTKQIAVLGAAAGTAHTARGIGKNVLHCFFCLTAGP